MIFILMLIAFALLGVGGLVLAFLMDKARHDLVRKIKSGPRWTITIPGLCAFLLCATAALCQATPPPPAPPPDPFETGWNISVNGGISTLQQSGTNNGAMLSTEFRLAQHWSARADVFLLNSPSVTVSLAKPTYRFSAQHIPLFKSSPSPLVQNMEFFVDGGVGAARFTDPAKGTQNKFAAGFGGGFDVKISDTVTVRPLDVNYIYSKLIGGHGAVVGNHLQFAASLGLRWGK